MSTKNPSVGDKVVNRFTLNSMAFSEPLFGEVIATKPGQSRVEFKRKTEVADEESGPTAIWCLNSALDVLP